MATTEVTLTGGANWVEVVAADKDFLIENGSSYDVYVTFQDAPPSIGLTAYHVLADAEAIIRMNLAGIVYARSPNDTTIDVSTS